MLRCAQHPRGPHSAISHPGCFAALSMTRQRMILMSCRAAAKHPRGPHSAISHPGCFAALSMTWAKRASGVEKSYAVGKNMLTLVPITVKRASGVEKSYAVIILLFLRDTVIAVEAQIAVGGHVGVYCDIGSLCRIAVEHLLAFHCRVILARLNIAIEREF